MKVALNKSQPNSSTKLRPGDLYGANDYIKKLDSSYNRAIKGVLSKDFRKSLLQKLNSQISPVRPTIVPIQEIGTKRDPPSMTQLPSIRKVEIRPIREVLAKERLARVNQTATQ